MEKVNKIINGDCIEVLRKMEDESVDLIFADPPYWMRTTGVLKRAEGTVFDGVDDDWDKFKDNKSYNDFTKAWLKECYRVLKKDGSFWVIGGMQCIYTIGGIMQDLGFWIINDVIWHKTNPTPNFAGTRLQNAHETLIWAVKDQKSNFTFNYKTARELNIDTVSEQEYSKGVRKQLSSVWRTAVAAGNERLKDEDGKKLHNTQKPEELLYRIIAISSKLGDLVLDPFGGTMTTAAVAKRMGRNYIMIEQDKNYCDFGQRRIDMEKVQIGDIEKATFDIKPIKVTMQEMIETEFFKIGETFYLKNHENEKATLLEDGKLLYREKVVDMHSCAAIATGSQAKRKNGFDYWFVLRDNNLVSIAEIRENYRNYLKTLDSEVKTFSKIKSN